MVLTGLYINKQGRERNGIVTEKESDPLLRELKAKFEALRDPVDGSIAIKQIFLAKEAYRGLYASEAPDLIVGYAPGYRVSWDCVTGILEPDIFSDNLKAWSGDHHVFPDDVPGIFFANRPLVGKDPSIMDLAPTTLDIFGVKAPGYMEGKVIL